MILKNSILILAFTLSAATLHAQESQWQIQTSGDGTILATIATDHPTATGTFMTVLSVGFGKGDGCIAELGLAILKGNGYGRPIGKTVPSQNEPMELMIDQVPLVTPAPFVVVYSNGAEALFAADQSIVQALLKGAIADVRIIPGTPTFEFSISGASAAIDEAHRRCVASE
jgi:hypothetical protein